MNTSNSKDKLSNLWFTLSNALPPIGFFLYFKHRNEFPNKARRALVAALLGIPVALIVKYVMDHYV